MQTMEFRARAKKPRRELSLPQLTFHHADHWMKVLGMEVFAAWLMIYTWCDREQYPHDDVSHHKNMKNIAESFGCKSVDKAQKIIKKLYEYGLLDIAQEKNKYGSMKNIYYWYDIPIYADSMFCELRKCRNWEDRNSHGQELVKLRKIKEKLNDIKSRTKKSNGLENHQENSTFHNEPYEKIERQPIEKIEHNNVLNNTNYVVDVKEHNSKISQTENDTNPDLPSETNSNTSEIQKLIDETCGVQMPSEFILGLVSKYGEQKVREKIPLLGRVETENAPGFLIAALKDDYQLRPGRPRQRQSISRASPQRRPEVQKKARDSRDDEELRHRKERKEIYKTLYAG